MTKVKGTIVSSIEGFVKDKFADKYDEWRAALTPESKDLYSKSIYATEWYPLKEGAVDPTIAVAKACYDGDNKMAGYETGKHSAQVALTGIYKVFVLISTPQFIMKRGSKILSSFYEPSVLEVKNNTEKSTHIIIKEFPGINEVIEHRIAGWMDAALIICGCKNITIEIVESLSSGDNQTLYHVNWE